jgi:hypothetical protein
MCKSNRALPTCSSKLPIDVAHCEKHQMHDAPTSAKLKHDIDSGRGGDKIDAIDLAAAPLGTDDEAAGTPPTRGQLDKAHRIEIASLPLGTKGSDWAVQIYVALLVTIASAVLGGILLL